MTSSFDTARRRSLSPPSPQKIAVGLVPVGGALALVLASVLSHRSLGTIEPNRQAAGRAPLGGGSVDSASSEFALPVKTVESAPEAAPAIAPPAAVVLAASPVVRPIEALSTTASPSRPARPAAPAHRSAPTPAATPGPQPPPPTSDAPTPAPAPATSTASPRTANGPAAPHVDRFEATPNPVSAGKATTFRWWAGDDDGIIRGYVVDFGDGTSSSAQFPDQCVADPSDPVAERPAFQHTYSSPGTYHVTLRAWSGGSCGDGPMQQSVIASIDVQAAILPGVPVFTAGTA